MEKVFATIALISILLNIFQLRAYRNLDRSWISKWAKRPIGRIISTELTKEGLIAEGEIWDDDTWQNIAGDMEGFSIGTIEVNNNKE